MLDYGSEIRIELLLCMRVFTCLQFALDEAINLPWENFTQAHFCLNPPGVYYMVSSLLAMDNSRKFGKL